MLAIATFPTKALPLAAGSCGAAASDHPHEPQGHPQVRLDLLMLLCPLAPAAGDEPRRISARYHRPLPQGPDCNRLNSFQGLEHKIYMNH